MAKDYLPQRNSPSVPSRISFSQVDINSPTKWFDLMRNATQTFRREAIRLADGALRLPTLVPLKLALRRHRQRQSFKESSARLLMSVS
jgi:hypothetical protein